MGKKKNSNCKPNYKLWQNLDINKKISGVHFLGSFVLKNVSLKKHIIKTKTAVHMTDSSKRDGFCWCNSIVLKLAWSNGWNWAAKESDLQT